jgi:adenylate cyclase
VVLAQVFDYTARSVLMLQGEPIGGEKPSEGERALLAQGYIGNNPGFSRAACVGNIGYRPDQDGILRRIPIQTRYAGLDYPHFSRALMTCGGELQFTSPATDAHGQWRIPYGRALDAYTVIPAAYILNEQAPADLITGRYVLVGSSSLSLGDRVITPLSPITAGVMVHAVSLSGLLDLAEASMRQSPPDHVLFVAWCVLSTIIAAICIARFSAWGGVLLLLGFTAAWGLVAMSVVVRGAEWSLSAPLWGYFMLLLVGIPYEWRQTQQLSRGLLSTLSHYVARPVLNEILRRNLTHSLEPKLCQVTVLVADMENYTATISSLPLSEAATLTKNFLACLTRPVLAEDGTLDKYTGDGLVAFWGAPLPCADQADRALQAAKKMLAEVATFNMRWQSAGHRPLRVRIGIESGTALVGDLGTDFRSTYTAVGYCINVASRLEEAARHLPTNLVIGPVANASLKRDLTKSMGSITLRGISRPIEVFQAL